MSLPVPEADDELTENRQTVLILRLTLDQHSQLLHGELLNAEGIGQGRFKTLTALGSSVERWLERQQDHDQPATDRAI